MSRIHSETIQHPRVWRTDRGWGFQVQGQDAFDAATKTSTRSLGATAKAADMVLIGTAILGFNVRQTEYADQALNCAESEERE